jgi:hypothetical protein
MKILSLFSGVLALQGCATLGVWDSSLRVKVKPFPIIQGKPFVAEINAPPEATEVVGHALVPLDPEMRFKRARHGRSWKFSGTIPKVFYIHPGTFKVRVSVFMQGEKCPRYTEMKMVLKGGNK